MKKIIIYLVLLFFGISLIFSERIKEADRMWSYSNKDGSLDFITFYKEWHDVPNSYFMYLYVREINTALWPAQRTGKLWKQIGTTNISTERNNDITFIYEKRINTRSAAAIELIFSPNNYSDAGEKGWIIIGQKGSAYDEAIERWGFILKQYD
jgi:hypothetical protein